MSLIPERKRKERAMFNQSNQKSPYEDIIHLPHPTSQKHPRMERAARAAQFMPFRALTGYEDAVAETARLTDRRIELEEEEKEVLDRKLRYLEARIGEHPNIRITVLTRAWRAR